MAFELECTMTDMICAHPDMNVGIPDSSPAWLYVGNESKLYMSRDIVRLYEKNNGGTTASVEEEQKSSGIFLATSGYASQWSRQTCYPSDRSMRKEFVFKPSDARFDLLIVGNNPLSSGLASEEHLVFNNQEQILLLTPEEPCIVAFDSYHQVEVEATVEFRIGSEGVPVFGLVGC